MYLLEKLPHLKQLKLWFEPNLAPERYQIRIENKFVVIVRKDNAKDFIKICFDCEINREKAQCCIDGKFHFVTLPIVQDEFNDETDDFPTADELNISKYSLISCKFCENTIYNHSSNKLNKLAKVYPLPSEYWLELSDMWFCCQSHQIDFNAQEIRAKENSLLMGKLHCMIHSNNIVPDSIKMIPRLIDDEYAVSNLTHKEQERIKNKKNHSTCSHTAHSAEKHDDEHNTHEHEHEHKHEEKDENVTSWDGVQAFNSYCSRCETLLGISYKTAVCHEHDNDEKLDEHHLWKFELNTEAEYTVPYSRQNKECNNVYRWYSVENYFSTKIVETKKARLVHKYLIYDYNCTVFIRINLMSERCFIRCPLFFESSESNKMAPIIKLFFMDTSNLSFEENTKYIEEKKGHIITSSTENCMLLLECLNKYNQLYPPSVHQQMSPFGMKLTFLRLLSRASKQ